MTLNCAIDRAFDLGNAKDGKRGVRKHVPDLNRCSDSRIYQARDRQGQGRNEQVQAHCCARELDVDSSVAWQDAQVPNGVLGVGPWH